MTVVEKRSNSRKAGSTSCEAETCTSGSASRRAGRGAPRARVAEGEKQADRDRLDLAAAQFTDEPLDLLVGQLLDHAGGTDPLRRLEAVLERDQRARPGPARVVEAGAGLAADLEQVGETARCHQCRACAPLLEQGIGTRPSFRG